MLFSLSYFKKDFTVISINYVKRSSKIFGNSFLKNGILEFLSQARIVYNIDSIFEMILQTTIRFIIMIHNLISKYDFYENRYYDVWRKISKIVIYVLQ